MFSGHINALGATSLSVFVGLECLCSGHLNAVGTMSIIVDGGMQCSLATLML